MSKYQYRFEKTWAVAKWQIDDINEKIYAI